MLAKPTLATRVPARPAQLRWLASFEPETFPCLFDSTSAGLLGRHTLLAAAPRGSLRLWGDGRLEAQGEGALALPGGFLASLDAWWHAERCGVAATAPGPPFAGGWIFYLAYEFAAQLEAGLGLPALPADQLCALALRIPAVLDYDHVRGDCQLLVEADEPALVGPLERALQRAAAALAGPQPLALPASRVGEEDPALFRERVARARQHIAAGDIYQANLSREWVVEFAAVPDGMALQLALARANPAPFAACATLPDGQRLFSSSPERLVRVSAGLVETRPIAGTRPRQGQGDSDQPEQAALLGNPKERAEHVMLVDLERNDLGRLCVAGSVRVDEFMVTESYAHVHHIVSNVQGRLRPGCTPGEVLRAVFPGGTITGCPKHRALQLIGALEGRPRGAYTGTLGYLGHEGNLDCNILIRTASLRGTRLVLRAGAGIVADSDTEHELGETRAKARGLLRAIGVPG